MVSGHLEIKKGYFYAVLSYIHSNGKRQRPWIASGLPEKGNKRKAEAFLAKTRAEFVIPPPKEAERNLAANMLFADYLDQWLEIVKVRIKIATFASYSGMVKSTIAPYFRAKKVTLKELEARHIHLFYTEKLKRLNQTRLSIIML